MTLWLFGVILDELSEIIVCKDKNNLNRFLKEKEIPKVKNKHVKVNQVATELTITDQIRNRKSSKNFEKLEKVLDKEKEM